MTRVANASRKTSETDIEIELNIDGTGKYEIDTGVNFFNHMLESFSRHSFIDLKIKAIGDIEIDDHHTVEDVGILLGEVFAEAIGDKKGIRRMGHAIVPMDDSVATVAIDISGRSYCNMDLDFKHDKIGDLSSDVVVHFFESFASSLLPVEKSISMEPVKVQMITTRLKLFSRHLQNHYMMDAK